MVTTPHCPAAGVNVYVDEPTADVLITEGDHVPFILLLDCTGNIPGIEFKQ